MATIRSSCTVFLCSLVCVAVLSCVEARDLALQGPALRLVTDSGNEAEQCGPKLSIETPVCTVEKKGDGFELRRYPAGQIWAETVVANSSYRQACSDGFYRCFYFISGKNSAKESIEMTGPVHIKPAPEANGWKIAFFTPSKYKSVADVPTPTDPNVKIVSTEESLVAVSNMFGGFPSERDYYTQWVKLKDELDSANLHYDESSLVFAGYSSPFEIFHRKQEVHVTIE
ncbi:hypothetical protein MPTK1_2g01130 [Marchantia polymorpha subsp. ruderalis]|uniref:Heme-binding protein 2 n=2 Tax=Marchantia polymorpha TaxID=3197 RepID=A0A176VX92_MARPO|nr:hypothetical protein AXG93_2931s1350 [Marchantia polymorpha subsp. ruderalis]PTQ42716.1 hypothetical protein MARPO_0028s0038 [Marchantia polymorpha]BBN00680.1 hypothetical protein Mp_2g01130 [Marchantia polymorpha subsp. ruderalis]|eukprot:PTQ42716.1 hypothetical protein MARPO_0028s0038 [Marchantia polymorpha]